MQEMHKKYLWTLVAFIVLLALFFVVNTFISSKKASAPSGTTNEIEERVFYGPKSAPYVKGPTSPPPSNSY